VNAADIFLTGLVWAQYRLPEAGMHLIDALESSDPELQSLAQVMLEQEGVCSKELVDTVTGDKSTSVESLLFANAPANVTQSMTGDFWWLPVASA